ncbi:MAG: SDR family NAD(P)-dependent oxidoreductase [Anaerolineaceae bacterium]|nr:SDR family NAD(P)-dependent oxidoreductase [Anaerolineaceae bacterium]
MKNKTCLITGGNAGIGKAAAILLAKEGVEVIIACRNKERAELAVENIKAESGNDTVTFLVTDLSSRESIIQGCDSFRSKGYMHLDILIHNAADFDISRKKPQLSADKIETIWATNHLGPVLLTELLDPELSASEQARVITISSQGLMMHPRLKVDYVDPEFNQGGFSVNKAYYQSKLAQVMYTFWLAEKYRGTSKTANSIRVSNIKVDLTRYPDLSDFQKRLYSIKSRFSLSPEKMAEVYVWLAMSPELSKVSGKYFDENRRLVRASNWAHNKANLHQLMKITYKYIPELSNMLSV